MAAINLRVPSGLIPLTNQQVDDNFKNLNNALGAAGSTTVPTPSGTGVPLLSISPTTSGTFTAANITYTGGIIGSTSVINIGSGQIYKDASGNVGLGNTPSGTYKLEVTGNVSYTGTLIGSTGIMNIGSGQIYKDAAGKIGIGGTPSAVAVEVISTDSILIPKGTTVQRPTAVSGYIRYNTTTSLYEGNTGTTWLPFVVNTSGTADAAGVAVALAIALG
jgi:hypothetical protein